ncbi:PEP-CTERM sorting domain-containing protein [Roseisolibacter agri]|uniref:Ice-binding protein C-terminal domain-containing protein n=1 Tax=Roseisolibacter agri TaxID=2014610 RepID=A0AA37QH46_9BACT|nr:PEP-CTERM sorting domain-containing protein [Roseisolibacter agri]GLC26325.1 hypothetical protein rosag_28380 [Roseisolibacter agri]
MRLLSAVLARVSPIATVVALLAVAPSSAQASSYFTTFTDRAKYLAQVSASGYTNTQANIGGASNPSSIGGVGVSTNAFMELGTFGSAPALFLHQTEGGNAFSFAPGAAALGFGLSFLGADNPGAATVTVSFNDPFPFGATEESASDGTPSAGRTVQYQLGGEQTGFFGVVLRDGILSSSTINQVTITTDARPTVVTGIDVAAVTTASTVPEPATYALMGTGLLVLAGTSALRRRRAS